MRLTFHLPGPLNRPAGRRIAVDGVGHRITVLRKVGLGRAEFQTAFPAPLPSSGATLTSISLSTKLPCGVRPGPPLGSDESASASIRKAVTSVRLRVDDKGVGVPLGVGAGNSRRAVVELLDRAPRRSRRR